MFSLPVSRRRGTQDPKLSQIKIGDRVWIGDSQDPRQLLQTVYKVTDFFVMCGLEGRFHRNDGRDYRSQSKLRISGVATLEEINAFNSRSHRDRGAKKQTEINERNRARLLALLPDSARLRIKEGTYELWLDEFLQAENLTEAQVRRIVALLSKSTK